MIPKAVSTGHRVAKGAFFNAARMMPLTNAPISSSRLRMMATSSGASHSSRNGDSWKYTDVRDG